jgi:hypothetical protein
MSHTFWGFKIEPKQTRKVAVPQNHVLHITHAAVERPLDGEDSSGRVAIRCKSARSPLKFVICTLSDTKDQCKLDLKFASIKAKAALPSTSAIGGRKAQNVQPQNSQSSKGKYTKKGRAKKRQPDLLEVNIPQKKGEKRKSPSTNEEKGRREQNKAVAEFSHVGDWNYPVHLTGYLIHETQSKNQTPKSELMQLKSLINAEYESTTEPTEGEGEEEGEEGVEEGGREGEVTQPGKPLTDEAEGNEAEGNEEEDDEEDDEEDEEDEQKEIGNGKQEATSESAEKPLFSLDDLKQILKDAKGDDAEKGKKKKKQEKAPEPAEKKAKKDAKKAESKNKQKV